MALKGDLASVDLAQVFQMLALNQKVGLLCIQAPRAWRALYFEPRGVCLYFNEHVLLDKVLQQLTRTGRLPAETAQEVRDHAAEQGIGLADALMSGGCLTESELTSILRTEMMEEVYDLFFWTDAHFEFFEGATTVEGRDGQVDTRFTFSTDSLIMEAARRIDEWSFIQGRIKGPLEIFTPLDDGSTVLDIDESALALLDLVDGKRNVARLIEITGMPSFLVYKGLAALLDEGLIDLVQPGDLLLTAQECVQEGRYQDAINLYEKAIAVGEGLPQSHEQVAAVYEKAHEYELSAYHHKCVAEFHAAEGDAKRAIAILQHVVQMLPTDLAARERIVQLTVGRADLATRGIDPIATGKELVDLYLEIGEIDRVRNILERLLRDNPFDIELKKSLINVHTKAGDTKRVVELYESIAEDLVGERQPIEAIKYLQKILMLDRGRRDISERIRSLYVLDERRRTRRRSMVVLTMLFVALAGLAAGFYFYDRHARGRLQSTETVVDGLLAAGAYGDAIARYQDFQQSHPFTLVGREVDSRIAHILSLKQRHEASLEEERRGRRREIEKHRAAYKAAFQAYKSQFQKGNLDEALAQLETVEQMVQKLAEPADVAWAQENNLDSEVQALKDYMSGAIALDRQADELFASGDWREARRLWVDLVRRYELSSMARQTRLPVFVRSRPAGATVVVDGQPVLETLPDGSTAPKLTPCLLMCRHDAPQAFELQRAGFAPSSLRIDAREVADVDEVLGAVASETFRFPDPVRGRISVQRSTLAAGLRGGRIALVRLGPRRAEATLQLPGLDELEGAVQLTPSTAVLVTRDSKLTAYSLTNGGSLWSTELPAPPLHQIQIHGSRVLFFDTQARLSAYDVGSGRRIWSIALPASPLGVPQVDGRLARVALRGGSVMSVDLADGRVAENVRVPGGIATDAIASEDALVYGTTQGKLIAYAPTGERLLWQSDLSGSSSVEAHLIVDGSVLAIDGSRVLHRVNLRTGVVEGRHQLGGTILSGPVLNGERVLFTLRRRQADGKEADLLVAIGLRSLEVDWEYRDGGQFAAGVAATDDGVFLPNSAGEVLRF